MAERPRGISFLCILQFIGAIGIGTVGALCILQFIGPVEVSAGGVTVWVDYPGRAILPTFFGVITFVALFIFVLIANALIVDSVFVYIILGGYPSGAEHPAFITVIGVFLFIFGILGFNAAYGLWNLKRWGFWLTLILNIFLIAVLTFFVRFVFWTPILIGVIIPLSFAVSFVIYLIFSKKHFI